MRKYKLTNKSNEEISFNTLLSNVKSNTSLNNVNKFHIHAISDIYDRAASFSDNADNGMYTIDTETPQEYVDGSRYKRGSIVRYKGQVFMARPLNSGDLTVETIPSMYSENWIAISDNQCEKLLGWDKAKEELGDYNITNFGNILNNLPLILARGQFYTFFNDGDYYILTDSSGNQYTMRISYNEWMDDSGNTWMSVDAISDEVIPYISYNINEIFESSLTSDSEFLYGVGLTTIFARVFNDLAAYRKKTLTDRISFGQPPYTKTRNYNGFYRQFPLKKGANYGTSREHSYYMNRLDDITKKRINEVPNIWLPLEKEVFGLTYNTVSPATEASFKQYKVLNTAFKRVKTLNKKPVCWMTMSIYNNTQKPIIVDMYGNEVNYESYNNYGGFNEPIYLPLCVTLLTLKK